MLDFARAACFVLELRQHVDASANEWQLNGIAMSRDAVPVNRGFWGRLTGFARRAEPLSISPLFPVRSLGPVEIAPTPRSHLAVVPPPSVPMHPAPTPTVPAIPTTISTELPKTINMLWLQGAQQAPDLVRFVFRRWAELNPGHLVRVLDWSDAERILADVPLPLKSLPPQVPADLLRTRLLLDGGVWADATLLPTVPLDDWLPEQMAGGFFAFDRPGPDRPLSNWFLAATPNHPMMHKWLRESLRFWSRPRKIMHFAGSLVAPDPVATVEPERCGQNNEYPYFWHHYLFRYLMETDAEFAAQWQLCGKSSAQPPHQLQWLFEKTEPDREAILQAIHDAPVHKLNWRKQYPLAVFTEIAESLACASQTAPSPLLAHYAIA
jgi:Capsular polysaccharide synthesis protein